MNYEIEKMIVFSTSHITENDALLLETTTEFSLFKRSFGFAIFVNRGCNPDTIYDAFSGFSSAFQNLVKISLEQNCNWLMLDCDGLVFDHLQRFDW